MKIYIDIDGVINADVGSPDFDDWQVTDHSCADETVYRLTTSRKQADSLFMLASEFNAELIWLTDWASQANDLIYLTGLPRLKVEEYGGLKDMLNFPKLWWKRLFIQQLKEPFIWLDDNIRNASMCWNKNSKSCPTVKVPHLALSMNAPAGMPSNKGKNNGLRLTDLELMRVFMSTQ